MASLLEQLALKQAQVEDSTEQSQQAALTGLGRLAAALGGTAYGVADYPRKVLQGERQVMNPATGHVGDEAIGWAVGQAAERMPQAYAAAMKALQSRSGPAILPPATQQ